nr:phosphodiester glycosidase family protein [Auraticoccus cholistanensis]
MNASDAPVGTNVSPTAGLRTAASDPRQAFTLVDGRAVVQELASAATVAFDGRTVDVDAVNSPSWRTDELAVFTPVWGSHPVGRLVGAAEPVRVAVVADGVVRSVGEDHSVLAAPAGEGETLLVARGDARARLDGLRPGQPVAVDLRASSDVDLAVGGSQRLLTDGVPTREDQVTAARTAVGVSRDGTRLWVVAVDGRQADAHGMTIQELAALMADLGAWNAINLDGGGSTTLVARPAGEQQLQVVNRPSDGQERLDSNALVFRSSATGPAEDVLARPLLDPPVGLDADGAHDLLPGLSRTVVGVGLDADLAGTAARGRFTAAPGAVLRTDGGAALDEEAAPDGARDGVVVRGRAPGRGTVSYAGRLPGGRVSDRVELTVHGEMTRLEPSSPVLALPDAPPGEASAELSLTAYDADGFAVPVETRDVEVGAGPGLAVTTSGPTGFAVTATGTDADASEVRLRVLDTEVVVPVTIGFRTSPVADFSDGEDWQVGTARATATLSPAPGPDGAPAVALDYDFTTSTATRGAYALPPAPLPVPGQPQAFTLWIEGDGHGAWPRLQVTRGDGTSTNLDGPHVDWTGWRQVTFAVPAGTAYPLTVTAIRFMEIDAADSYTGRVAVAGLDAQVAADVEQPEEPFRPDPVLLAQGDVDERPQRVAVMSDTQFVARDGADGDLVRAGRRTLREIVAARPDLLVVAGDLVDEASEADLALARQLLEEEVGDAVPWVYVPGNHEVMGGTIERFEQFFGPARTSRDLGPTRVITLDSSSGTLHPGGSTEQLRELEALLDDAAADRGTTGVVVVQHHPVDDPHPDAASQLTDRVEAAALQRLLTRFRAGGKSVALVTGHVGTFSADARGGVSRIINGNSGKSPSGAADEGGFTGWTMLGIDPGAGIVPASPEAVTDRTEWLVAETHARVDSLTLQAPDRLAVGGQAEVTATVVQDGGREVAVAWPVTATWSGDGVRLAGSRGPAVVELDPASGRLTAVGAGTATVTVEVNGETAEQRVVVGR